MTPNDLYAELLSNYLKLPIALLWIVITLSLILIAICLKVRYKRLAVFTLVGGMILAITIYFTSIFPAQKDINENAFISYSGEFVVEECYSVSSGGTYIIIKCDEQDDAMRYKVLCDVNEIDNNTSYNGTFVYSKHSKCLVAIEIQAP